MLCLVKYLIQTPLNTYVIYFCWQIWNKYLSMYIHSIHEWMIFIHSCHWLPRYVCILVFWRLAKSAIFLVGLSACIQLLLLSNRAPFDCDFSYVHRNKCWFIFVPFNLEGFLIIHSIYKQNNGSRKSFLSCRFSTQVQSDKKVSVWFAL